MIEIGICDGHYLSSFLEFRLYRGFRFPERRGVVRRWIF